MATTANPPPGALALSDQFETDPFFSSSHDPQRQRYSALDNPQFSLYLNGSPSQAKRALQAHLTETARRLQEASHLGNALVQQKKDLEERLREIEQQREDSDIGPELRERLSELEKEFNEVGRETARVFLPKSRVPSGETDTTASASVYSSEAFQSPSKVSVPSRKQRNQPSSRVNDITFATEISTSLLAQVKELQAALVQKDEALKAANLDRSQLEIEVEGLSQRLRAIDESESRLKDENWSLETQVRDLEASTKAAADKEHRLNQTLNIAKSEKTSLERELEELRQLHTRLSEEHAATTKHHETEISGLRRNVTLAETERGALQRKIEDLASQNQELAKAVTYRMKSENQAAMDDTSPEDDGETADTMTPDGSPPPSPNKVTPRHGQLESETLKHSLHHAHRMIQQLKNNIHREKTEKIELKRMLQDARDELETSRNTTNGFGSATKKKKVDKDVFKKPARPDRLGALRTGTQEIIMDDDDWEDHDEEMSPSKRPRQADRVPGAFPSGFSSAVETSTEGFETANDNSDAFETAHERDGTTTETDAFQTGAETLDGDSTDDLTETEAGPSASIHDRRPSPLSVAGDQRSYESTASTSGDDDDELDIRTPVQSQHPRYRLKLRGGYRRSLPRASQEVLFSNTPLAAADSPPGLAQSNSSTPAQGKSLFAELGDLSGGESDDGSAVEGTPSRSSLLPLESSPETMRRSVALGRPPLQSILSPPPQMVDNGTMTDPWEPSAQLSIAAAELPAEINEAPAVSHVGVGTEPAPAVSHVGVATQPETPKRMGITSFSMHDVRPVTPPTVKHTPLLFSSILAQHTAPELPQVPLQRLVLSSISTQDTEPQSPAVRKPSSPPLHMSSTAVQTTGPREPPMTEAVAAIPSISVPVPTEATERSETPSPASLYLSSLSTQSTSPVEPPRPILSRVSSVAVQHTAPVEPRKPLLSRVSNVAVQHTKPVEPQRPLLSYVSTVAVQHTEPVESRKPLLSHVANVAVLHTEPRESTKAVSHGFSDVMVLQDTPPESSVLSSVVPSLSRPQTATRAPCLELSFSGIASQHVEPEEPRVPSRPVTAHRTAPAVVTTRGTAVQTEEEEPTKQGISNAKWGFFKSVLPLTKGTSETTTEQKDLAPPVSNAMQAERNVDSTLSSPPKALCPPVVDFGTQTMVSAQQIDKLLLIRSQQRHSGIIATAGVEKQLSPPGSPRRSTSDVNRTPRRPGSAGSTRSRAASPPRLPPLPSDHKEVIAAAALKSGPVLVPTGTAGSMGPPTAPASAYKKRPQTPTNFNIKISTPSHGTTPRARNHVGRHDTGRSGASSPVSRQTSVSSFASEIDYRFNNSHGLFAQGGIDPTTTDPRMIQAITQTMMGEFLWKYTRKAGNRGMSENRHRRFFWVHPYTRTLYWSEKDPATAGKDQLKAKSVAIEAVQVVTDDNPYPPGLHRKSLIVITPGREIKFTAPTGQRHETWFNALSYLLLRTSDDKDGQTTVSEDVPDFNPANRSSSRQTARSRTSMSSYVSRITSSPHHAQIPTLRHSVTPKRVDSPSKHGSMSGRLSSLGQRALRPGSFSSRRSRVSAQSPSIYERSIAVDSAEDVTREIIEEHERSASRTGEYLGIENVRACCDGKHDVGSLTHKHRHHSHTSRVSAAYSMGSRSHSRADSSSQQTYSSPSKGA
ncbi:hypothetical protein GQ43DRAFT_220396 [Delitschia confertaspora ATCC 74209]|uniref:PH domain-containing protein n=1 Tax=Delitschia confertaspora ATCC 74209 TaxID=1513339 RepID=A0A9P4JD57_9PLEO|nr:hypothetical protein GQ43DRAFT_220396 [Delitschia confertaspora ATCC 74209]